MTDLKKFLIFSQKSFFNFQKTELSYILGKVCSNPWHIQNPVKHLRWNDLQKKLPGTLFVPSSKNKKHSEKKRFLYFRKRKFRKFKEMETLKNFSFFRK